MQRWDNFQVSCQLKGLSSAFTLHVLWISITGGPVSRIAHLKILRLFSVEIETAIMAAWTFTLYVRPRLVADVASLPGLTGTRRAIEQVHGPKLYYSR